MSLGKIALFIVCSLPSACGAVCCLVPCCLLWKCKLKPFHKLPWLWHFTTARKKLLLQKLTREKLGEGNYSTLYNTCILAPQTIILILLCVQYQCYVSVRLNTLKAKRHSFYDIASTQISTYRLCLWSMKHKTGQN